MSESVRLEQNWITPAYVALMMYSGEPCRICERLLSADDIRDGAVFVGYSADNKSRAAHRTCFENAKQVFIEGGWRPPER